MPALVIAAASILAVGGAHPRSQVGLATATLAVTALTAFASRGIRRAPFAGIASIGLGLSCLQVLPLPAPIVRLLSPHAYELRTDVVGTVPSFMPLSVDVPATVLEICKGFACIGMLMIVARVAARERRTRPLLWGLSAIGVGLAVIAFVQRQLHTDTILGVYQVQSLPGSFVFGTFVNANHAASILELAALVSIGLSFETAGRARALAVAAATICAGALFFTASRGGAVSFVLGGFFLILILVSRRYGARRGLLLAVVVALVTSVAALALADGLRARLMPGDANLLLDNQKTHGWKAAWQLGGDFPWVGVGRGGFEAPAAAYRSSDEGVRLVYPENLPLQIVTEWGIPAFFVLLPLFAIRSVRILRRVGRMEPAVVGAACGVFAVLVHDLVDFGLEMPGVALPTIVALGVVAARGTSTRAAASTSGRSSRRLPLVVGVAGAAAWVAALVAGTWAVGRTLTEDGAAARAAVIEKAPNARAILDAARARHPADYYLELMAAIQAMTDRAPTVMHHLNRALRLNPGSGQTHAIAARWLARLGRRQQAALEFRLASEHGVATTLDEIYAAVGAASIDAVPQETGALIALSQSLSAHGHAAAAAAAARRAAERSDSPDGPLVNVVDIAMASGDPALMVQAADYVLAGKPGSPAIASAVKALFTAGEKVRAVKALDVALARLPNDAALVLAGARLRFEFGDPAGAREVLTRSADAERNFHLSDLVALHELLAAIADKMNDADAAVIARARARLFARRLSETQTVPGFAEGPRTAR